MSILSAIRPMSDLEITHAIRLCRENLESEPESRPMRELLSLLEIEQKARVSHV